MIDQIKPKTKLIMIKNQLIKLLTDVVNKNLVMTINDGIAVVTYDPDSDTFCIDSVVTGIALPVDDQTVFSLGDSVGHLEYPDGSYYFQVFQPLDLNLAKI